MKDALMRLLVYVLGVSVSGLLCYALGYWRGRASWLNRLKGGKQS